MAFMYSYLANNIFVIFVYYYKTKLLANRTENNWVYIDNKKNTTFYWVLKAQSHHSNKLFNYYRYCQVTINCIYNIHKYI